MSKGGRAGQCRVCLEASRSTRRATEDRQGGEAGEVAEVVPPRPWWVIEGWSGMMDRRLWA